MAFGSDDIWVLTLGPVHGSVPKSGQVAGLHRKKRVFTLYRMIWVRSVTGVFFFLFSSFGIFFFSPLLLGSASSTRDNVVFQPSHWLYTWTPGGGLFFLFFSFLPSIIDQSTGHSMNGRPDLTLPSVHRDWGSMSNVLDGSDVPRVAWAYAYTFTPPNIRAFCRGINTYI